MATTASIPVTLPVLEIVRVGRSARDDQPIEVTMHTSSPATGWRPSRSCTGVLVPVIGNRACLSDARTRKAHLSTLSRYAEQNFRDRLTALGKQPRVPVPVMARAFVGAHVAILEAWLAGKLDGDVEELASMALHLLIYGAAWAHGFRLDELGYSTGSSANARTPSSD